TIEQNLRTVSKGESAVAQNILTLLGIILKNFSNRVLLLARERREQSLDGLGALSSESRTQVRNPSGSGGLLTVVDETVHSSLNKSEENLWLALEVSSHGVLHLGTQLGGIRIHGLLLVAVDGANSKKSIVSSSAA